MSKRQNDVSVKGFEVEKAIGEGAFAKVYLCRKPFSRKKYAAKIVSYGRNFHLKFQTENEIEILKLLGDHRNIVRLQAVIRDEASIIMILEYIAGCNLYEGVMNWYKFTETDLKVLMKQLFGALSYCEEKSIIHKDVAPENILLVNVPTPCLPSRNVTLKLIDFNLSRKVPEGESFVSGDSNGNPSYMAPETLFENPVYSFRSDVWSAGVILFVLTGGYPPFWDDNYNHLLQNIRESNYVMPNELWDHVDISEVELIRKILVQGFHERPSAEEILNNPWLNSQSKKTINWLGRERLSSFLHNLEKLKKKENHRTYKLTLRERVPYQPDLKMLTSANTIDLVSHENEVTYDENNNVIVQSYW